MKIRTLWKQMTFYDDDGNIIKEIPERPPEPPPDQVKSMDILDYFDRLAGRDPNEKPDFFIDLDSEEYQEINRKSKIIKSKHFFVREHIWFMTAIVAIIAGFILIMYSFNL